MPAIAVVTDLIFSTKITGTAKALGKQVIVARTLEKLQALLDSHLPSHDPSIPRAAPMQVLIDLNVSGVDPLAAVTAAKSHPSNPRIIAYLSHVQVELAQQARQAGADEVLARSSFVHRLPELLAGT